MLKLGTYGESLVPQAYAYMGHSKKRSKRHRKQQQRTKLYVLSISALCVLTSAGVFAYQYVAAYQERLNAPIVMELDPNLGIKPYIEEFLTNNNATALLPIIACESGFKHFEKDGSVLKNKEGSSAIGIAQILASKHPDPKVLDRYNKRNNTDFTLADFDITTVQGNIGYALVLYQVRGTRDWECAKL